MKITAYKLLGMIKDGKAPNKIKFNDGIYNLYFDKENKAYYQDDKTKYILLKIKNFEDLDREVEILEEEKRI